MDLDNSPLFKLKVSLTEAISPGYPFGNLHWEGLEMVTNFLSVIFCLFLFFVG